MVDSISLVFTGDIGFDKYMDKRWEDEELISEEVLEFLQSGNHVIANVEGAIVEAEINCEMSGTAQLLHTMNPGAVKVLRNMGADIWSICNNHIMDAGQDGLNATIDIAKKNNCMTMGAGRNIEEAARPIIIEKAGGIGLFGVGYQRACRPAKENEGGCFSWSDLERIEQTIKEIKSKCRWCIIVAHAGEEFTSLPMPYTRDRYLKYLEMGADVVVAHHPHVPMNYERVGEKTIFYSLGNFIFDTDYQRVQFNTEKGLLIKLEFTDKDYSFIPFGLTIDRKEERIVKGELPKIFTDVQEEEYKLLAPLAAKMLIAATKRQWAYLKPKQFKNATEKDWEEDFANPKRSGRVEGETLDFFIICPLAKEADNEEWKKSSLEEVKEYILEQM